MLHKTWLDARRGGISGSNAAAIMGVNPYESPYSLWCEKAGFTTRNEGTTTREQGWGHKLESVIADYFAQDTGHEFVELADPSVELPPDAQCTIERYPDGVLLRNKARPWLTGSIDKLVRYTDERGGYGPLECKNVGIRVRDAWLQQDGSLYPPPYVMCQAMHYQLVTGWPRMSIAVLVAGNEPGHCTVEPAKSALAEQLDAADRFWQSLMDGEPPELDGSEWTKNALAKRYPEPDGNTLALPPEAIQWDLEFVENYALAKKHKKLAEAAKNNIRAAIGPAARGVMTSGTVWTNKLVESAGRASYLLLTRKKPKKR